MAFDANDPETVRALSEALARALRHIEENDPDTLINEGRSVVTKALVERLLLASASDELDSDSITSLALSLSKNQAS